MTASRMPICVVLPLFLALSMSLHAQRKYALVIGNGAYTSVTKLNNPVNDAMDMKTALESLGFTVDLVVNGAQEQMESAAMRLRSRLSAARNSYGFFFYAGHAVQSGGENYLVSVHKVGYFADRPCIFSPKGCENAIFKEVADLRSESIMCLHYGQTLFNSREREYPE